MHCQVLKLRVREDQYVMATKGYSSLSRFPKQEPHHQMKFNILTKTPFFLKRDLFLCSQRSLSPADRARQGNDLCNKTTIKKPLDDTKVDNKLSVDKFIHSHDCHRDVFAVRIAML